MTLMPGVADPNYQQSGGINNPGRTMSLTINGQPSTNTVVRLDGITATNQFFENIQSYGPSLEAIETVNVVTSSFDADQGMAGAAAVNVQVKTGTNNFRGSAFEYATDARMRARNYFLPADRDKGTSSVNVFGGTLGGPIVKNKLFFFFSDETTRQRTFNGNAQGQTGTSGFVSLPPADLRRGDFSRHRHADLRPADRQSDDRRRAACRSPLRTARRDVDDRSALRVVQLHSVEPHQPDRGGDAVEAGAADAAGIHEQLFRDQRLRHDLSQDRREDYLQPGSEIEPQRAYGVPAELGALAGDSAVGGRVARQSAVAGARLGFVRRQPLDWRDDRSCRRASSSTARSATRSTTCNVFPPVDTCYGDVFGIPNSCQPPYSLDTNVPDHGRARAGC